MEVALDLEVRRKKNKPLSADAALLCSSLFGVVANEISELDSYDDKNFIVTAADNKKYVLKVHNGVDSLNLPFIQAQNDVMLYLHAADFLVPTPVRTLQGGADGYTAVVPTALVDGTTGPCAVRLLHFLPLKLMCDVVCPPPEFFESLGTFMGRVDLVLAQRDFPALHRAHLWDTKNLPLLRNLLQHIDGDEKKALVNEVSRH